MTKKLKLAGNVKSERRIDSDRRAKIDSLIATINKELGSGRVVIQRGENISHISAKRYSTGSLGLDIAMNGGLPQGMLTQYKGEESSGKTTMAVKGAGLIQQTLGDEAAIGWIAVEPFDKRWANQCGCAISFSATELKKMSKADRAKYEQVSDIGTFVLALPHTGEDAFDTALRFIKSRQFQLVVIDSIAAVTPMAEEEKEIHEHTMGQLPRLVNKFLRKLTSALNSGEDGETNQTAVLVINQVRDQIGVWGHPEPSAPGGRGLKHALSCDVRFKRGEILKKGEKNDKFTYGKRTKIRIEKNKVGPPFREAEFDFYFDTFENFKPGDIDVAQEIRLWGVQSGVIQQTGNRVYHIDDQKFTGKETIEAYLRENEDVAANLYKQILRVMTASS